MCLFFQNSVFVGLNVFSITDNAVFDIRIKTRFSRKYRLLKTFQMIQTPKEVLVFQLIPEFYKKYCHSLSDPSDHLQC